MSNRIALAVGILMAFSVPQVAAETPADEYAAGLDALRINQLQVIGSHNSYKAAIEPALFEALVPLRRDLKQLDYAHPPLTDQLNLGLRSLELDVYHDPHGGRFATPLGLKLVQSTEQVPQPFDPLGKMQEPGFKIFHVQDLDFRSHCLTLADALTEIREWSDSHPRHLPVVITFNTKESKIVLPGSVHPLPFDRAVLDELDAAFLKGLGKERLIQPDGVRGHYPTLEAAVRDNAWPTLKSARGKFLLVLDQTGRIRDEYLAGHEGLKGRVMFVNIPPGNDAAAFMIRNSPTREGEVIGDLVRQGYLVRTRADSGTIEARKGDLSRFQAAMQSGAHVISTDFYLTDWRLNPTFRVRFDKHRCWRLNPVTRTE